MSKLTPGSVEPYNMMTVGKRDAFHVPAVLVVPVEGLSKGQHVQFCDDRHYTVRGCIESDAHGIIDPFLKMGVTPDQQCWMFLNPELLLDGSLSHYFEIDIPEPEIKVREVKGLAGAVQPLEEVSSDECSGCYGEDMYPPEPEPADEGECAGCY